MRALVATGDQDLIDFSDVPDPRPAPDEALVAVRAVSANRGELHRLTDAAAGWRPGWDFSGVIARTAASGDGPGASSPVFGITLGQSWAEYVAVPVRQLAAIPEGVSWEQAAALPTAALTALRTLRIAGDLAGRAVLVTGAAGGVGRFAVQLANASGAKVTAVVGRPERASGLEALGAKEIHIGVEDLVPGYDVILESGGGDSLGQALRLVAPGGTIVSFGNSARAETRFSVSDFYPKMAVLRGYYVLDDLLREPPADDLHDLITMYARGELITDIAVAADWHTVRAVLADLRERCLAGKAVLRVGGH